MEELFMKNPRIPEISRLRLKELLDLYLPLETSCGIYECEKLSLMMEFWKLAHKALVDGNVSRSDIDGCVLEGGIVLRNNATDFVNKLAELSIPLIIFSGGIGNVIETVLTSSGVSLENVRVVSNFMDFNPENDEKVELFSSLYDLVLLNDETFDIPLFILSSIVDSTELCKHESNNETPNI
ncbi:unnamed protein product [Schistosoma haematobium]|nr:unnamed protein product [Schistosoma haematobium]